MTTTTKDLIDAAKAIGIEAYPDPKYPKNPPLFTTDGKFYQWLPQHDKSQLMDLQFKLGIGTNFDPMIGEKFIDYFVQKENRDTWKTKSFENDNFESFAEAIILAAAEIGRGMK